ncbi:MAG TPA: zinc ribbon domain-containing protein [bacterium]|nr:zinc ribbon domain-containing protein [bacterium]HOL46875.1 zinc ribbon domain-containing protein [bacterium]HPQ18776.1 zinc ribbon domain-containing protein [bacterium]
MPIYEYECQKCGHKFELLQKISDKPVKKCPECKANKVIRLITGGAGIIFKGTGFYTTDYKNKTTKKEEKTVETKTTKEKKESSKTEAA